MLIKYRYPIQEPEKSLQTMMCLYRTKKKKSTNILGVSMLSGTRWNPSEHVQTCYVSSRPNELFSIFLFLYFLPSPPISPLHPHILFLFLFGEGRGGEGNGQGTATAPGGSHHHHRRPVGRSPPLRRAVAPPPKGGGDKVPPPFSIKQKTNKIYKSNDISTLDNKNNIL